MIRFRVLMCFLCLSSFVDIIGTIRDQRLIETLSTSDGIANATFVHGRHDKVASFQKHQKTAVTRGQGRVAWQRW